MLYRQAELAEERSIILNAIGYAKDPNILSQVCHIFYESGAVFLVKLETS